MKKEELYKHVIKMMGDVSELRVARELKYFYKQPDTLQEILADILKLKALNLCGRTTD